MFDVLRNVDRDVATEALYLLGLRFHERPYFPGWRHWLQVRSPTPHHPRSMEVAAEVIEEIETRSGKAFEELSEDEVTPYRSAVYAIVERRQRSEGRNVDPERARRILEEMRRDYGQPRAVA
jgi:hypothetical protein